MIAVGVGLGLGAAFCQSLSYLATRQFVQPRGGGSRMLLVLAHVIMGAASLAALPLVWPHSPLPWRRLLDPLIQSAVFYLLGQLGLMVALRHAEPSRISPMLAFKLVILGLMSVLVAHQPLTFLQWVAIGLCLTGTLMLNYSGGKNHPHATFAVIATCVAYSLSDWNIGRLVVMVQRIPELSGWRAPVWSTFVTYVLSGLIALPFLPRLGSRKKADWIGATPFAAAWLVAMLLLYGCFGTSVGVIGGNILQSTRGLINVLLASLLARWGLLHLESIRSRGVMLRRLLVALLMLAAVALYQNEVRRKAKSSPPAAPALPAAAGTRPR